MTVENNKKNLKEFITENAPLLNAFGVFTALSVYFKGVVVNESIIFAPLFLSLLIIFELYRNLPKKENASTILNLFEGGLFLVLFSVLFYILSTYTIGRLFFGMALAGSVFVILYPRIKKHLVYRFKTHKKLLAALYSITLFMWGIIWINFMKLLNFEPLYKEILTGFLAGIILLPLGLLIDYLFDIEGRL